MYIDLLKNPIVIGVLLGVATYLFLLWNNGSNKSDRKTNKNKDVSLLTPIVVAVVGAFMTFCYFNNNESDDIRKNLMIKGEKYKFTESPVSYHLISKGVSIPGKLPEVFIETY